LGVSKTPFGVVAAPDSICGRCTGVERQEQYCGCCPAANMGGNVEARASCWSKCSLCAPAGGSVYGAARSPPLQLQLRELFANGAGGNGGASVHV